MLMSLLDNVCAIKEEVDRRPRYPITVGGRYAAVLPQRLSKLLGGPQKEHACWGSSLVSLIGAPGSTIALPMLVPSIARGKGTGVWVTPEGRKYLRQAEFSIDLDRKMYPSRGWVQKALFGDRQVSLLEVLGGGLDEPRFVGTFQSTVPHKKLEQDLGASLFSYKPDEKFLPFDQAHADFVTHWNRVSVAGQFGLPLPEVHWMHPVGGPRFGVAERLAKRASKSLRAKLAEPLLVKPYIAHKPPTSEAGILRLLDNTSVEANLIAFHIAYEHSRIIRRASAGTRGGWNRYDGKVIEPALNACRRAMVLGNMRYFMNKMKIVKIIMIRYRKSLAVSAHHLGDQERWGFVA